MRNILVVLIFAVLWLDAWLALTAAYQIGGTMLAALINVYAK